MTMSIDKKKLEISKSVLKASCYHGYFTFLISNARHQAFLQSTNREKEGINFNQLTKRVLIIQTDLMIIATIVHRINYELSATNKSDIQFDLWRYYSSLDIESLFRKFRSLFDNIVHLLKSFLGDSFLPDSFNVLYKNINKYDKIPTEFKDIIIQIDWFGIIKEIRDKIDHYAAEVIAFYFLSILFFHSISEIIFFSSNNSTIIISIIKIDTTLLSVQKQN